VQVSWKLFSTAPAGTFQRFCTVSTVPLIGTPGSFEPSRETMSAKPKIRIVILVPVGTPETMLSSSAVANWYLGSVTKIW